MGATVSVPQRAKSARRGPRLGRERDLRSYPVAAAFAASRTAVDRWRPFEPKSHDSVDHPTSLARGQPLATSETDQGVLSTRSSAACRNTSCYAGLPNPARDSALMSGRRVPWSNGCIRTFQCCLRFKTEPNESVQRGMPANSGLQRTAADAILSRCG